MNRIEIECARFAILHLFCAPVRMSAPLAYSSNFYGKRKRLPHMVVGGVGAGHSQLPRLAGRHQKTATTDSRGFVRSDDGDDGLVAPVSDPRRLTSGRSFDDSLRTALPARVAGLDMRHVRLMMRRLWAMCVAALRSHNGQVCCSCEVRLPFRD